MDEFRTRLVTIDWISRILSVVSLVLAGWVAWQTYTTSGTTPPGDTDELRQYVDEQLTVRLGTKFEEHEKRINKFLDDANSRLATGIKSFEDASREVLDTWDQQTQQAQARREKEFQQFVSTLRDDAVKQVAHEDDQTGSVAEINGGQNSAASQDPNLMAAELRLRPSSSPSSDRIIRLYNDGSEVAAVNRVEFTPLKDFPVSRSQLESKTSTDVTTIVFDPSHNTATEEGAHATYAYDLEDPIEFQPGQELNLRFRIANAEHEGYGFRGTVRLFYNNAQVLPVPDVEVVFQRPGRE
jgi:hypothetical protein